jgi:hypothetical protein
VFGIDIETLGLALDDEVRLVQISNGEDTFVIDVRESDPRPLLQEFTGSELIAHNANFEEARLKRHLGIEYPEPLHDTMVMSQVLYGGTPQAQGLSHSLEAVAMRELDIELDKELQKANWGAANTPGRDPRKARFLEHTEVYRPPANRGGSGHAPACVHGGARVPHLHGLRRGDRRRGRAHRCAAVPQVRRGGVVIYAIVALVLLCVATTTSLLLALLLAVELANGEAPRDELRIPEWVSNGHTRGKSDAVLLARAAIGRGSKRF